MLDGEITEWAYEALNLSKYKYCLYVFTNGFLPPCDTSVPDCLPWISTQSAEIPRNEVALMFRPTMMARCLGKSEGILGWVS